MIPMIYEGGGRFLASSSYHAKRCDQLFGEGQEILFTETEERSLKSHRHYFARLKELWKALPESMELDFPTVEDLRKWALIRAGYCTTRKIVCQDNKMAIETAAFIESLGTYVLVEVVMRVVTIWVPQSQSYRAMTKDTFQRSKDDVLEVVERLVAGGGQGSVIPFQRRS